MDKKLILQNHDPEQCFFCSEIDAEELIDCVMVGINGRRSPTGQTRKAWVCFECLTGRRRSDCGNGLSH